MFGKGRIAGEGKGWTGTAKNWAGKGIQGLSILSNVALPFMMFMPPPGAGGGGGESGGMPGGINPADQYESALNREMQRQTYLQNSMRGM